MVVALVTEGFQERERKFDWVERLPREIRNGFFYLNSIHRSFQVHLDEMLTVFKITRIGVHDGPKNARGLRRDIFNISRFPYQGWRFS